MKKSFLVLLPILMLTLSACDLSGLINNLNGDDDESSENADDNTNGGAKDDDDSIFDKPESLKKLMAFGKNTGFEIVSKATESESNEASFITLGMKGDLWWLIDEDGSGTGYRLENNVCSLLTYSDEKWEVLINNVGETQFNDMFESITGYLYEANSYFANEGFVSNGAGKYAGRDVLKYKYHRAVATVSVDHEYYIDKDLGINLYEYGATTRDGATEWAKLETTSFKTGNDVQVISISA